MVHTLIAAMSKFIAEKVLKNRNPLDVLYWMALVGLPQVGRSDSAYVWFQRGVENSEDPESVKDQIATQLAAIGAELNTWLFEEEKRQQYSGVEEYLGECAANLWELMRLLDRPEILKNYIENLTEHFLFREDTWISSLNESSRDRTRSLALQIVPELTIEKVPVYSQVHFTPADLARIYVEAERHTKTTKKLAYLEKTLRNYCSYIEKVHSTDSERRKVYLKVVEYIELRQPEKKEYLTLASARLWNDFSWLPEPDPIVFVITTIRDLAVLANLKNGLTQTSAQHSLIAGKMYYSVAEDNNLAIDIKQYITKNDHTYIAKHLITGQLNTIAMQDSSGIITDEQYNEILPLYMQQCNEISFDAIKKLNATIAELKKKSADDALIDYSGKIEEVIKEFPSVLGPAIFAWFSRTFHIPYNLTL